MTVLDIELKISSYAPAILQQFVTWAVTGHRASVNGSQKFHDMGQLGRYSAMNHSFYHFKEHKVTYINKGKCEI